MVYRLFALFCFWTTILNLPINVFGQQGESQLPIVRIDTDGATICDEPKIVANMTVFENGSDGNPQISSQIQIETRGNTAQYFPKKCYGFKSVSTDGKRNNLKLLGMPPENDWVLYASYSDKTFVRDGLSYNLFRQMGHYAPRARHCILYINDEYQGIYILTEKIKVDNNRVNIGKSGALLELTDLNRVKSDELYFTSSICKRTYVFKNPDTIDEPSILQAKNLINSFESIITAKNFADSPLDRLAEVIDIQSLADYILLNEAIRNVDVMYVSTFWHVGRDGKLQIGPLWDCDIALGNANYMEGWKPQGLYAVTRFYAANLFSNKEFKNLLNKRWGELRSTVLSSSAVIDVIDSLNTVVIPEVERNFARWNTLGRYVTPNYFIGQTYGEEINYLKNWVLNRFNWLDSAFQVSSIVVNSATRTPHSVSISVTPSPQALTVSRSSDGVLYSPIGQISAFDSIYIDTLLRDNSQFYYSICGQNASNQHIVMAWTPLALPPAPVNLTFSFGKDSIVLLQWEDRAGNESNYVAECIVSTGYFHIDTLPANTQNHFVPIRECSMARVFAYNRVGRSDYSNSMQVEIPNERIDLFPTIVTEGVWLEITGLPCEDIQISVIDGLGRSVYSSKIMKNTYSFSYYIEMGDVGPGLYTIFIRYSGQVEQLSVVKR